MPTVLGHALVGAGLLNYARPIVPAGWRRHAAVIAGIVAMAPDADVAGFRFGVKYGDHFGHRGFSHSLVFAAILGILGTARLQIHDNAMHRQKGTPRVSLRGTAIVTILIAVAAATHPLLDMLTDGGLGCALLAPFSWRRLFFDERPIPVSPIGLTASVIPVLQWEMALFLPFFLGSLVATSQRAAWIRALGIAAALSCSAGAFLYLLAQT